MMGGGVKAIIRHPFMTFSRPQFEGEGGHNFSTARLFSLFFPPLSCPEQRGRSSQSLSTALAVIGKRGGGTSVILCDLSQ